MTWAGFVEYIHELNTLSIFLRMFLATLFGALLGMDRAKKHRPAGFRTHMLVCLGSAVVMLTNQFLIEQFGGGDPARLGAQVISGIGFLGAGTIIVTRRNQVLGLTTAAGLWADACIGLAIGIGFYSGAIIAALFIFFIIVVMSGAGESFQKFSKYMQVYVEFTSPENLSSLLSFSAQNGIIINAVEIVEARHKDESLAAMINMKFQERVDHEMVIERLRDVEGINFITLI